MPGIVRLVSATLVAMMTLHTPGGVGLILDHQKEGQNKWWENNGLRNFGAQSLHAFIEDLTSHVNFFLPSAEKEDIIVGFREVDLHDSNEGSIEVIGFRFLSIKYFHGICLPQNREDGTTKKNFENFSASRVADVMISFRSGQHLMASMCTS